MTFRIRLTAAANSDIRAILHWIAERSPAGAESWYQSWLGCLGNLVDGADRFGKAPESEDHSEPIYQALFQTKHGRKYRPLFAIRSAEVFVLHVRGPGQRPLRPDELR